MLMPLLKTNKIRITLHGTKLYEFYKMCGSDLYTQSLRPIILMASNPSVLERTSISVVASIIPFPGMRNTVNPSTASETGTLRPNLGNTGSHSEDREYEMSNLDCPHTQSHTALSCLEEGQPCSPAPSRGSQERGPSTISACFACHLI